MDGSILDFLLAQASDQEDVAAMVVVMSNGDVRTFASFDHEKNTDIHAAIRAGADHIAATGTLN